MVSGAQGLQEVKQPAGLLTPAPPRTPDRRPCRHAPRACKPCACISAAGGSSRAGAHSARAAARPRTWPRHSTRSASPPRRHPRRPSPSPSGRSSPVRRTAEPGWGWTSGLCRAAARKQPTARSTAACGARCWAADTPPAGQHAARALRQPSARFMCRCPSCRRLQVAS